eukprot:tig00020553_g10565.t1
MSKAGAGFELWSPGEFERFQASRRARPPPPPRANPLAGSALRVNQLDALKLESELVSILKAQFGRIFRMFEAGAVERWQAELDAGICFLIFLCSVWRDLPLPGDKLQNLRFESGRGGGGKPGRLQKLAYAALAVGARWVWSRASAVSTARGWGERPEGDWRLRAYRAMNGLESAARAAALLNFFSFLRSGRYRGLPERVAGLRLVPATPGALRRISFEFMNRQMVWSEFTELMLFVLPLVNTARLRSFVLSRLRRGQAGPASSAADPLGDGCALCGAPADEVSMPHAANPCGHVFCYYCIRSALAAGGKSASCGRCGAPVLSCSRYVPRDAAPAPEPEEITGA